MNWKKILLALSPLAAGALIGYFIGSLAAGEGGEAGGYSKMQFVILLLCLPFMYLFVVGWHELGHVLVGLTQRFKFMSLTIGPFAWKRRRDRIRFEWNKSINLAGGLAYMLPLGDERMGCRFATFAAGGPGSSLLLAVLGGGASVWLPEGSFAELVAGATGWFSFVIFLLTAAPFRAGGFSSDGRRILTLLGKSEAARHEVTLLRVIAFTQGDRPLGELPIGAIEAGVQSQAITPQYRALFDYYRYLYYLSQEELDRAETALAAFTDNLETFPPGLREGYYLEVVLFYVFERPDLARAEAARNQFRKSIFTEEVEMDLAGAGLARLRGNTDRVAAKLPLIESLLEDVQEPAKLALYRRWLAVLATPYAAAEEEE